MMLETFRGHLSFIVLPSFLIVVFHFEQQSKVNSPNRKNYHSVMKFHLLKVSIVGLVVPISHSTAATIFEWEPLPYFSEEDSPFIDGIRNGSIYLENFEDQALNTPFVTAPTNLGYFGTTRRARNPNRPIGSLDSNRKCAGWFDKRARS
jgi:hypothetical protein